MRIVLITLDCVRADHLVGGLAPTPGFDRLRAEGTTFGQAFAQSQNTLSSHLALLTSNYLFQHGVYSNHEPKPLPEHALPRRLAEHGVAVEAFASVEFLARALADQIGSFDERFNHAGAPWWSHGWQRLRGYPSRIPARRTLDRGLGWLDEHAADKDAFLWLHLFDAHMVYAGRRGLVREETRGLRASRPCAEALAERGWQHAPFAEYRRKVAPEYFPARYRAAIRSLDAELERLCAALKRRGSWDDLLLIVTSDHGECLLGDQGLYCMHQKLFDETTHVPLWIRFPGGEHAGRETDELVEHVDVAPTILAAMGIEEPLAMGRDLAPVAAGLAQGREVVYSEHVDRLMRAVRDREHVLVEPLQAGARDARLLLGPERLFRRDGTPVRPASPASTDRDATAIAARLEAAGRALRRSRPDVARAWGRAGRVDERIATQLKLLGYS